MNEPSIKNAKQPDHFAYIFSGIINIPEDGIYEFMTKSDDGSHAAIVATGRITLKKGYHSYKLSYFEDYEGEELSWGWKKHLSTDFESIPPENLFIK